MMDSEVTDSPELSVGGPPSVPSRISVVLVEEAKAGGTPRLGCLREDQDIQLLPGVAKPASVTVWEDSLGSPCVGGTLHASDIAGRLLPVIPSGISFPVGPVDSPALSVGGPPSVPSRISVVLVEEAKAEGTPCLERPREDQDMRLLAGVAKPASVTVCIDSLGSPCVGGTLSSSDIAGRLLPVVPAGISFPLGPVEYRPAAPNAAGGTVGPYGTLSPSDADPASSDGPYVAEGPVGPYGTLSPSDSDPAGRLARILQGALFGPWATYTPRAPPPPHNLTKPTFYEV